MGWMISPNINSRSHNAQVLLFTPPLLLLAIQECHELFLIKNSRAFLSPSPTQSLHIATDDAWPQ